MNDEKKRLLRDILFCLQLGFKVVAIFMIAIISGIQLDKYFKTEPKILLGLIFLAFGYVMKILLGVGKE